MTKERRRSLIIEHSVHSDFDLDKSKLIKILENSFDEIFVVNKHGIVIYVNEACQKNYDLKPSDVIGKTVHYLVSEGYYTPAIAPLVFKTKKAVTLEQETKSGRKLLVTAIPVFDEKNELDFIVMNSRNITEIEQLRQDLEKTKEYYKTQIQQLRQKELVTQDGLVFQSEKMREFMHTAQRVAPFDTTILILGESGTGKNLLAKQIHTMSNRRHEPYICINCAAIPEQLLESELFGYTKGAFTGAERSGKPGLIELAHKGTLFLDEIGEIPLSLQAKLLQLVQDHTFIPIGGTESRQVDIRIISATNCNLPKLIEQGRFRLDLYYRLNVIEIEIPPVRERSDDIVLLLHYFLNKFDIKYSTSHYFSEECLAVLQNYPWPGNVREIEHLVERLVITVSVSCILPKHLPLPKHAAMPEDTEKKLPALMKTALNKELRDELNEYSFKVKERETILELYENLRSSYKVASILKISQSKVSRIVRTYSNKNKTNP
ncbi:sigma 54-interacting transcriptional regulator [Desulfitobacterium chlororespirans]|uniref:sigma-54 interaction domain-containing protein n=1 Tax=Desulfitobacterium chlororespirans TaxID=51616 RepID=UPI0009339E43